MEIAMLHPHTCPKCHHVREKNEQAPEWQCPACGVAYAKVADSAQEMERLVYTSVPPARGAGWGKGLLIVIIVIGALFALPGIRRHLAELAPPPSLSETRIKALAATVKDGDIVMYSTTECVYCAQAKSWLDTYGFVYKECNMSVDQSCEREFMHYGATGTPLMIVHGQALKEGFDSDAFLAALQR
jgi:glutaredoxin